MPSNRLILCCSLLLPPSIFPSVRVFSKESVLCIRWPKYWSFNFSISISPSNECLGLISFRMDWLDLFAVQGTLKSLLQHHSSKALILQHSENKDRGIQSLHFLANQFSSVSQLCLTFCNPVDWSTPGFPVHHQLPELAQAHVHWVGDAIQPSHPLLSPSLPAFNLSQRQDLFQWVSSSHHGK